ncbi:hypothetical protein [Flavobacterium difficile]|uniref:ABC transporter ATP-binding protein n=1 Tax=Flavobacterium difficile TaxID=2709659 RepID=A0ABX0I881_9FLAO|nr:hypothetical protein [Flavobacterium difficile]NHM01690.1 hypothetical protein [Flavobacterium difficile]
MNSQELKEIKILKVGENKEINFNGDFFIVKNVNNEVVVLPKPKMLYNAIALFLLMLISSFLIVILSGGEARAGGFVVFVILLLYKSLALEIQKLIFSEKIKNLKSELNDVKFISESNLSVGEGYTEGLFFNVIMSFLMLAFVFCGLYALFSVFS